MSGAPKMTVGHVHLTPEFVQAVRDAAAITPVAEDHTRLQKRGGRWLGLCPLHKEKTPSFTVDPDRGLFYCFGCGRGGDAIKLHMMLSGDDFAGAMESLARRFGVPLPARSKGARAGAGRGVETALAAAQEFFVGQLERSSAARAYLEGRGFSAEVVERFGLGYAPDGWENLLRALRSKVPVKDLERAGLVAPSTRREGEHYDRFRNRLIFPIHSPTGRLVGFGGRTLGDDRAKYINSQETESFRKKSLLYGLHLAKRAIRDGGEAVLCEGYFDVIALFAAGVETAVASMGTSLTEDQARLLAGTAEEVVVAYDGDEAGWAAYRRGLPLLLAQGLAVRRARLGDGEDPDTVRDEDGDDALVGVVRDAPDALQLELDALVPGQAVVSPSEQARLAGSVLELLEPVRDPVLRFAVARRAAERLGLPESLLTRSSGRTRRARAPEPEPPVERPSRAPGFEQELAALGALFEALDAPEASRRLPTVDELLPPEAFWNAEARNIWAIFCALYTGAGEPPSMGALRARLDEDGTGVDLLARVLIEGSKPSDTNRASWSLERVLESLRSRWLEQRIQALAREITEAQRAGDHESAARLTEEKMQISRQKHVERP